MFIRLDTLKRILNEVVNGNDDSRSQSQSLRKEKSDLEHRIRELEHKKELEEKELTHLVKMKEEKQFIEAQKKEIELQKKFNEKEMTLQTEYHKKNLDIISKEHADIKEIYKQIMERLPNVNVEVKRK